MSNRGPSESEWRPGRLDRVRAFARRMLIRMAGRRTEAVAHNTYHQTLRLLGRFAPPEDHATQELLRSIASRSRTILDVGANVGRYAWFFRQHAPADSTLIAIEPHPAAARLLRSALKARPGCLVLELAAADTDGHASLRVPDGAFGTPIPALSWVDRDRGGQHQPGVVVRLRRIDSLMAEGALTVAAPVLLKIDVEGSEGMVLRGAADLLRRFRPAIYMECQATHLARQREMPEDVWELLRSSGYQLFALAQGEWRRMAAADPSVVNYFGFPDVGTADTVQPRGETAASLVEGWATHTGHL